MPPKTNLPKYFSKIKNRNRPEAIKHAQKALTDYLHSTRSLPFIYAENIGKNSLFALSDVVSKLNYSSESFVKNIQKLLSYNPINEFEFFYESIGISHSDVRGMLLANKFFLSEDDSVLKVAYVLSEFGFPWNKLGLMFKEDVSIFRLDTKVLNDFLYGFKSIGYNNATVIGICLAFPQILSGGGEFDALLDDLKRVFLDFDLMSCVEENVDSSYEVCRKIRVFYNMGCEKGKVGELMGRSKHIFVEYPEEIFLRKIDFFCRLGVDKEDIACLILRCPEILSSDLETGVISVIGFLKHFGMSSAELKSVTRMYPYLLGKNKMSNLPNVMRALHLHGWFFNEMENGNHHLLGNYKLSNPNEVVDEEFIQGLEKINSSKYRVHTLLKLNFMHKIGFGENGMTLKILIHLHGTSSDLQARFDFLIALGVEYSNLCRMISVSPNILIQKPEILEKKVNFLCQEMGSSLEYLNVFPFFLNFNLENRIKPRYKFHMWLRETGLYSTNYSIASVVATSEKNFISRISRIHPAAPKYFFECFAYKKPKKHKNVTIEQITVNDV